VKIATLNINSVRAHWENIEHWLRETKPDVVLLQEIKCETHVFPTLLFNEMGYNCAVLGQKSYNGVAILARESLEDITYNLPTFPEDPNARYIEALVGGHTRIATVYTPNGNPVGTEKFEYKLEWYKRFNEHVKHLGKLDEPVILGGDYNVIRFDRYAYNPAEYRPTALMRPEVIKAFEEALSHGFRDAYNELYPASNDYTWFSYRAGSVHKNHGLLIDYFLVNDKVKPESLHVDMAPRKAPKASDHAPLVMEIKGR